jgi:hypothetical protein
MKRNRSLIDILSELTLNEEHKKPKYNVIQKQFEHEDVFNIGKISLDKEFYSKTDVLTILNAREATLYKKFVNFFTNFIYQSSIEKIISIPSWIK